MNREAYLYSPYYCEENVWHLCQQPDFKAYDRKVALISNDRRSCALWHQRARTGPDQPILWDYHVVLLFRSEDWQVYDLDTLLETPTPIAQYIKQTFKQGPVPEPYLPVFRIIDADEFVSIFSSDRSHMLTADGKWQVPPPPWPAIVRNNQSNLMELIDMRKPSFGTILDLSQFENLFAQTE
jgi:hypothetical protein